MQSGHSVKKKETPAERRVNGLFSSLSLFEMNKAFCFLAECKSLTSYQDRTKLVLDLRTFWTFQDTGTLRFLTAIIRE